MKLWRKSMRRTPSHDIGEHKNEMIVPNNDREGILNSLILISIIEMTFSPN